MKAKTTSSKLADFLAKHGVRYKWEGTWPAIPVKLGVMEFDERKWRDNPPNLVVEELAGGTFIKMPPPDVTPAWVENIFERLCEKILPPKKGMTLEFYDAAIYGYAYSSLQRERTARLKACKSLPAESDKRKENEALAKFHEPDLDSCRQRVAEVLAGWTLKEAADYLEGFAYGIKCQLREESWTPSAKTETLQIHKALLREQYAVETMIRRGSTAKEIGEHIAKHARMSGGVSFAEYFEASKKGSMELFQKTTQDAEVNSGKIKFQRFFEKICERVELPLLSRELKRTSTDTK